jgi:hypothetical protein
MKIKNRFVRQLIEEEDPFPAIFAYLLEEIWRPQESLSDFYAQEERMTELEKFLTRTYDELFTSLLPRQCSQVNDLFPKLPTLYLDSLSLREGVCLQETLEAKGYSVSLSYSFSAIPSITTAYKEKITLKQWKKNHKYAGIKDLTRVNIAGDEEILWCDFPDALFESLASGKTVLDTIENAYRKVEALALSLIETLESDLITIRSDHGYVRHQPVFSLPVDTGLPQIRKHFGGGRYVEKGDQRDLPEELEKYIVSFGGYDMAKSQYVWPVAGKYHTLQHGGISLMECLTPVLEIRK